MKSIATIFKYAAFLPLACLSLVCFSQGKDPAREKNSDNGKIEFVKAGNGNVWFKVNLANIPVSGCLLQITNQSSEVIFEDRIKGERYVKTFQIPQDGLSKLYFEVNGKKYKVSHSFDLTWEVESKLAVTRL